MTKIRFLLVLSHPSLNCNQKYECDARTGGKSILPI